MHVFDVSLEVAAKCFVAVRAVMRLLTQVDSFDMFHEALRLAEWFVTKRTLMRLLTQVDSYEVSLEGAGSAKCFVTLRAVW